MLKTNLSKHWEIDFATSTQFFFYKYLLQLGPKLLLTYDLLYFTAQGCVSVILNTSFRLKKTLKRKQVKSNHVKAEIQGSFLKCPAEINLAFC